jgi:hypothetical protein
MYVGSEELEAEMFWRFFFGRHAVVLQRHRRMYPGARVYRIGRG